MKIKIQKQFPHKATHIHSGIGGMLLMVIIFHIPSFLYSQRLPLGSGGGYPNATNSASQNNTQNNTEEEDNGPDSTIYKYVLLDNIFDKKEIADSLADISFLHKFSMSRNGEYVNTGNFGSSVQSIIYENDVNTGFSTGYKQYRFYQIRPETYKFYEQNRPLTDLFFSQIGGQENIIVGADFSRNFDKGLSVSLNYNRISQKGFYNIQDTKSTAFGIGLRYQSPKEKYNAILLFTHNANQEAHIGGIKNDTFLNNEFKKDIPVFLDTAATRQQERSITLTQYYKLNSVKNKNRRIYLRNDFKYLSSYYKFSDANVPDSINQNFYSGLNNDERGLRRLLNVDQFSEGFYINGEKVKGVRGRIGLVYDFFNIVNQPTSYSRSDLTATFDGKIPFLKLFEIETKGRLGLLSNVGNFDISGKLNIKVSKVAGLDAGLRLYRSEPTYNSIILNINDISVKDTSFTNPFGTILFAEIKIPIIKFSAGLTQSIISNPIYWPQSGFATQYDKIYTITQLHVSQKFKVKRFHLDNTFHFQLQNEDLFPIPKYFSTHQLYYAGQWFKKVMDVSIGVDARFITDYKGPAYQPLFGSYTFSNTTLPFFPASNFFIMIRISSFRGMFVMENFSQYFRKDFNYDVVNNPQFDPKFRMAFNWLLKD